MNLTFARRLSTAISSVALLLTCTAANFAYNDIHHGTIRSIESTKIVLTSQAQEMTFLINSETQVSLDGKPVKATDLMAGDDAMVASSTRSAHSDGDFSVATRIDAHRGSTPGNPDTPDVR